MHTVDKLIWERFRVKRNDTLPFTGWADTTRVDLAKLFCELEYKTGAEIGVRQGHYSQILLENNPGLKLICIDPWTAYLRVSQERQDRFYRHAVARLQPLGGDIRRMTSMEALAGVPDRSLDFCYVDGRHEWDFVVQDLIGWSAKVRSGGIVSGHDYYSFYQGGVIMAVDAFTKAHNINQWYITKESDAKNGQTPSFFWVNP